MKLELYSVFDKAVKAYMTPFFARARGEAIRSFGDAANDEKHQFGKHANDFVLYYIGEFDDQSGIVTRVDPERVISAIELLVVDGVLASPPKGFAG